MKDNDSEDVFSKWQRQKVAREQDLSSPTKQEASMNDPLSFLIEEAAFPACVDDLSLAGIMQALEPTPLPECSEGITAQSAKPAEDSSYVPWNDSGLSPFSTREDHISTGSIQQEIATVCVPKGTVQESYTWNNNEDEQVAHFAAKSSCFAVSRPFGSSATSHQLSLRVDDYPPLRSHLLFNAPHLDCCHQKAGSLSAFSPTTLDAFTYGSTGIHLNEQQDLPKLSYLKPMGFAGKAGSSSLWTEDDRPKRPLTAYNFFFQHERAAILGEQSPFALLMPSLIEATIQPGLLRTRQASSHKAIGNVGQAKANQDGKKSRKKKIGFANLARLISKKWQEVDSETKAIFQKLSNQDMERYRLEKEAYMKRCKMKGYF